MTFGNKNSHEPILVVSAVALRRVGAVWSTTRGVARRVATNSKIIRYKSVIVAYHSSALRGSVLKLCHAAQPCNPYVWPCLLTSLHKIQSHKGLSTSALHGALRRGAALAVE